LLDNPSAYTISSGSRIVEMCEMALFLFQGASVLPIRILHMVH
jgi:hypothetical protein